MECNCISGLESVDPLTIVFLLNSMWPIVFDVGQSHQINRPAKSHRPNYSLSLFVYLAILFSGLLSFPFPLSLLLHTVVSLSVGISVNPV